MSLRSLLLEWNLKKGAVLLGIIEIILSIVLSIDYTHILIFYDEHIKDLLKSGQKSAALVLEDNKNC